MIFVPKKLLIRSLLCNDRDYTLFCQLNYLLLVKSIFPFYYILAKSCPKNFPTQCQMFSNHIIQDEEKCYITDFQKVSQRTLFFCKIFFYFRIHFCQIKQRTAISLQADFFSDQWAYNSCVTIFYYLYCIVQEVYIGSPLWSICCINNIAA